MRYLVVSDIPAPWREKVYEKVYRSLGAQFHVVFCSHNEKRRLWKFPFGDYPRTFLKNITVVIEKENYFNPGIVPFMLRRRPRVVIGFSMNPTVFMALGLSRLIGAKVGIFADTWLQRDGLVSWQRRAARKCFCNCFAKAYVGASRRTLDWYAHYNPRIAPSSQFLSPLCADNDYFLARLREGQGERRYDLMFSGRIVEAKNPLFFADVAARVKAKMGRCSVLIIGDGDPGLKDRMCSRLKEGGVEFGFPGFISHEELPDYYSRAKVLLLPTSGDCWGVVINEAMVCGMPVVTTAMTAAAGELVLDGVNGHVLPLDPEVWTEEIVKLLSDPDRYRTFSQRAREAVSRYTFDVAAEGLTEAFRYLDRC